ncbi:hypothetical protein LOCC1_G007790 [Lachnellula occidentalis]|uniref:Uncharacterized protein n=1 Tax=Lachnellula occidentalis TaxID=215460 RepID=A0A8H8RFQ6_9HELO|nr:hypothetical protein LOCC1_G007790 [Lachnellula occidentalis]
MSSIAGSAYRSARHIYPPASCIKAEVGWLASLARSKQSLYHQQNLLQETSKNVAILQTQLQTTMSSFNFSYSSSSFVSASSSSGGQRTGQAYQSTTYSDRSGTRVQTTSQNLGQPPIQETRKFDANGRQILEGGQTLGQGQGQGGSGDASRRIEDVTDMDENESENDRLYRERMADEYAKREGGAGGS